MLRLVLVTVLALLLVGSSRAFCPSLATNEASKTALGLFFGKKAANSDTKGKTVDPKAKKTNDKEEKKDEGFVMLFGRPEYDWSTGKTVPRGKKTKRHNWLIKPDDASKK
jgi:hypothetical protein